MRGLVYPVPDPELPFLGVHVTRHIDGHTLLGPTALLAPARDAYRLSTVRPGDLLGTLSWPGTWKVARNFWRTGLTELAMAASRRAFVKACAQYVPAVAVGAAGARHDQRGTRPGGRPGRHAARRLRDLPDPGRHARPQRAVAGRHQLAGAGRRAGRPVRGQRPLAAQARSGSRGRAVGRRARRRPRPAGPGRPLPGGPAAAARARPGAGGTPRWPRRTTGSSPRWPAGRGWSARSAGTGRPPGSAAGPGGRSARAGPAWTTAWSAACRGSAASPVSVVGCISRSALHTAKSAGVSGAPAIACDEQRAELLVQREQQQERPALGELGHGRPFAPVRPERGTTGS